MTARRPPGDRIEPAFGVERTAGRDLRVTADDRVLGRPSGSARTATGNGGPKRSMAGGRVEPRLTIGADDIADFTDSSGADFTADEDQTVARSRRSTGKGGGGSQRGESRRRPRMTLGRLIGRGIYWCLVLGLWGGVAAAGVLGYTFATLPKTSDWVIPKRPPNVEILDASGRLIANRGDTGGEAVRLEQLPPHVAQAVIAIEDRRFYSHFGIDPIGLARAMVTNLTSGDLVQGGSTLTQQLAKNLFLEPDRTIERKLQEAVLALWLEWKYSKDEILEMYLNRVYLGAGAYGVDGAARRYFAKSARELTLHEAALLAGLLKAPSRYAPTRAPKLAAERAAVVLAAMAEEGSISRTDARLAADEPSHVVSDRATSADNYVADWVMDLLPGYVSSISTDIVVTTTIDMGMQRAAEAAVRETLAKEGAAHRVSQGALVAIDNGGAVKALVGGRDYGGSQFNRAVQARRQPGSAFKPFVFLTALEAGYTPDHIIVDEPVSIKGWKPQNYTREYMGPVTLTTALAKSLNTVAARLAAEVGPGRVANTARRVGILSRLHDNPSIALGTAEVTPLEITAAYVPFANGGTGVIPYVIDEIRVKSGEQLFHRRGGGLGRVVDARVIGAMNRMMQTVLETGTGQKAILPGRPAGGKTGTSQDFRDAWFLGYVNGLTAGVWLGNDDNSPTKKATGGSLTAIVWNRFMTSATAGLPVQPLPGTEFAPPPVLVETPVANGDGLSSDGSFDLSSPVAAAPAEGPTAAERGLLDRLFGG